MRLLLALFALLLPVSAQETMIREVFEPVTDSHVEVLALFTQPSSYGYFPVRVKIANNLKSDRSIRLRFGSAPNYGNKLSANSTYDFKASAGKTVIRDIMVPLCGGPSRHGGQSSVSVTLSGLSNDISNSIRSELAPGSPDVLMSEALFTPNGSALDSALSKGSSSRYGGTSFSGKFDPKQLPDSWLAFSGYDSLLMTDSDWSDVPAGSRNAILYWVRLGGQLVIYSTSTSTTASLGIPDDPSYGSILIEKITSDLSLNAPATIALVKKKNDVRIRAAAINSDFNSKGSWPLQGHFGAQDFNYGVFIAVLVLFGILVGPVNLFVFAKSHQRHRLFITTPLISLGASLILIALIIFQDGFGGEGMRRVLMEVRPDAGQNAAYLHQEQVARTGILVSSGFTVDPACLIAPVPIAKSRWSRYTDSYNTSGTFNLQPVSGKLTASGDWFQSRSEHGHALTAVISTRGRIERSSAPDTFVSTFDFPIETLYFLDDSKQWHRAESIATGKPFTLTPVDATMAEPAIAREAAAYTTRNREILQRAKQRPNHFIAVTNKAPGIDTLPSINWKETRTVITGPVLGKTETLKN